jgi:hypothetical protein
MRPRTTALRVRQGHHLGECATLGMGARQAWQDPPIYTAASVGELVPPPGLSI